MKKYAIVVFVLSLVFVSTRGFAASLVKESGKEPVVLVHGHTGSILDVVSAEAYWSFIKTRLKLDGYKAYVIVLPNAAWGDIKISSEALRKFVDKARSETGSAKVDIVCHSEGGLVSRYYMNQLGGLQYVDDLVTISTPHRGTVGGNIGQITGDAAVQMSVGSDFLKALNTGDLTPGDVNYTAIMGNSDEVVVPPANAFFQTAVNVAFNLNDHATILFNEDVYRTIRTAISYNVSPSNTVLPIWIDKTGMSTSSRDVNLRITAFNHYEPGFNPQKMIVSENPFFVGASWENAATTKSWKLSDYDGLKSIYVKFKEEGKWLLPDKESPIYVDYIYYDPIAPVGFFAINGGKNETTDANVKIAVKAVDNTDLQKYFYVVNPLVSYGIMGIGITKMTASESSAFAGAAWENFAEDKAFKLSNGYGVKTVYMKFADAAGNVGPVVKSSIELKSPALPPMVPPATTTTTIPPVTPPATTTTTIPPVVPPATTTTTIPPVVVPPIYPPVIPPLYPPATATTTIPPVVPPVATQPLTISITISFSAGWNLVTIPDAVPAAIRTIILDGIKKASGVIKVDGSAYDFTSVDTAVGALKPFWVNLPQAVSATFTIPVPTAGSGGKEIPLKAGWNLIDAGGLVPKPWDSSVTLSCGGINLAANVSTNYGFKGPVSFNPTTETYKRVSELQPFNAYFIKAPMPCVMKLP